MFIKHRTQETIQRDQQLRQIARNLRKNLTHSEAILWQQLRSRKLGYKFRRQHTLHGLIVDFYSYELMLVIEVDGSIHDLTIERDHMKDQFLASQGYCVIRFANDMILNHLSDVIKKIQSCKPAPFLA